MEEHFIRQCSCGCVVGYKQSDGVMRAMKPHYFRVKIKSKTVRGVRAPGAAVRKMTLPSYTWTKVYRVTVQVIRREIAPVGTINCMYCGNCGKRLFFSCKFNKADV